MSHDTLDLVVRGLRQESDNVMSLELSLPDGAPLPHWEPGAHLEVILPSGLVRHYSLCSEPRQLQNYRLAILRESGGRGGSEELHSQIRLGTKLKARGPRNHFKVEDGATHYLLVAGGIGITPIMAMARELKAAGKSTRLVYCGSSRQTMAFIDELQEIMGDSLALYPRDERGRADLLAEIQNAPEGTSVYACGPERLLTDLQSITAATLGAEAFHAELFGSATPPARTQAEDETKADAQFEIELRQSGCTLTVPPEKSILDVVLEVNPSFMSSCEEGFCGTCETKVLEGEVDHRDSILSLKERARNDTMFICVSRSKCPKLVLDA
ncbi:PDR/VanB family oxidoreductase [Arthrobacter sp. FW306-05-C]|uniref:Ferredoxin-NADP reductase n=1 Tax=Pseudarthrobacter enclensis TaxID=993070 RepID=A0ABT9RTY3_9MICC|nr:MULTISPECIES: PDR/VanB family oxidoreductase [Micrococcaceae]MDP9888703.1 ferredoxin-NADP reductase [Pseudarthrobacter enclensis]UKA66568.1 PDR/VanB family oxidoreductase [Arthrobacter sp. FW306-05-C]